MALYEISTHIRGVHPGQATDGWDPNGCSGSDYETPRALALFEAVGAETDDEEYTLCLAQDGTGRWALFGLAVEGHVYAVENVSR